MRPSQAPRKTHGEIHHLGKATTTGRIHNCDLYNRWQTTVGDQKESCPGKVLFTLSTYSNPIQLFLETFVFVSFCFVLISAQRKYFTIGMGFYNLQNTFVNGAAIKSSITPLLFRLYRWWNRPCDVEPCQSPCPAAPGSEPDLLL